MGAKERAEGVLQGALEVLHPDAVAHQHAFDLMEHGAVGGIDLILAVHPARGQEADPAALGEGGRHPQEGPDLHGAGVRSQQELRVGSEVEGVGAGLGRMVIRDVQAIEVVGLRLDLRPFLHVEAQGAEHVHQAVHEAVQGMQRAGRWDRGWQGGIPARSQGVLGLLGGLKLRLAALEGLLPLLLVRIDLRPQLAFVLLGCSLQQVHHPGGMAGLTAHIGTLQAHEGIEVPARGQGLGKAPGGLVNLRWQQLIHGGSSEQGKAAFAASRVSAIGCVAFSPWPRPRAW